MKRTKLIYALAGFGLMGLSTLTYGAPPPADTPIGNQAKATFSDESGVQREVFSNTVITRVEQIYALVLQQDNTRIATPASMVYFPHTVINRGNGLDSFDLTTALSGVNLLNVRIYPDANQDGLPDTQIEITQTPAIAAGASYSFVVVGIVPALAAVDSTGGVAVTATSVGNATVSDLNNDTFTVTNNAVLEVTKAINVNTGKPGDGPITYTLTYSNIGNSAATDVTIKDKIPAGMTYVPGSARWSRSGSTALTDAGGGDPTGIEYDFGVTEAGTAIFVIDELVRGESGFVTFDVMIDAGLVPGTLVNVAEYGFDTGTGPNTRKGPYPTNQVDFKVQPVAGVTLTPPAVDHPPVDAGAEATWINVVENTGTGPDIFDIIVDPNHTFPTGTTFLIYQRDGETPMVDSNGNGIPDTGILQPGETYEVLLKAKLPSNISGGIAPYGVTKSARSTVDPTVSDSGTDRLQGITAATVNLTDTDPIGGANPGGIDIISTPAIGNPTIRTIAVNPGTSAVFTLHANNTGPRPDSYNLLADMSLPFTHTSDMLAGWTATFRNSSATVVSNTGVIQGQDSAEFELQVTVPANALPGEYPVFVRILSPVTGAIDHIKYVVTVNTVRNITLESDNIGQTFPGGSIEYSHVLTNRGNVVEGNLGGSVVEVALVDSLQAAGFNSIVYYDANDNGVFDSTDPVLSEQTLADLKPGGLGVGESVRLFVKVFAPLGITESATNQTVVTASVTGLISGINAPAAVVNTDTTTIVRGDLVVEKRQAIDANQDGDITGGELPFVQGVLTAPPGAYIIYEIVVTNSGSADATGIVVYDSIPANTTYLGLGTKGTAVVSGGTIDSVQAGSPAAGATGSFQFNVGVLKPQESATIYFGVKIDE